MKLLVFGLAAAVLAYQIVLMRLFAIAQWHHFAAMIISLALLGFGLSGTLLARWGKRLRWHVSACAAGFLLAAPVCAWVAHAVPFTPMLIVWQPRQWLWLLVIYLVLAIPFTLAALGLGRALMQARTAGTTGRMYAANLLGSGAGALIGLALCYLPLPARPSEYKGLSAALRMPGTRHLQTEYHPLGRFDVVESPALQVAPGLSLLYTGPRPAQQILFVDGDGASAVDRGALDYLDWLPAAAPYAVRPIGSVLVIGVGGGTDVRLALRHGAREVTGVEMHPRVARFTAGVVAPARVVVAEGRAYVRRSRQRYDLIQISLLDSLATSATGVGAANEAYLYTVEALEEMLARLTGDGLLCITRWLKMPPRDELRMLATARRALERAGVPAAAEHLVLVRGWATGTVLVKRTPFTGEELDRLGAWAEARLFEVVRPSAGGEDDRQSLFDVRPVTDNRPYFFHFFRWATVPHLWRTLGREWIPLVEWGYVVLVATLAQAVVASVGLLALGYRRGGPAGRVLVYFACLGLGFMFVEMALIQKLTLLVGHPLYAAAGVMAGMLVLAGAGARWADRGRVPAGAMALAVAGLSAVCAWAPATVIAGLVAPLAVCLGTLFPLGLARIRSEWVAWAWGVNGFFSVLGAVLAGVLAMDAGFGAVLLAAAGLYACAGATFYRLRG